MKRISLCFLLCVLLLVAVHGNGLAQTTILHNFGGAPGDGSSPKYGALASDGSALYGATISGGVNSHGTIYKINVDGTGYELLHEFAGSPSDGSDPYAAPILDGSTLYGMTHYGGVNGFGVIYAINTDGTGYTVLHHFDGVPGAGAVPYGKLLLVGSKLYGMTYWGGVNNVGVIFTINTDGTGYALLHEFLGGPGDGGTPFGALIHDGTTLYGMTRNGGASELGTIFSINTDGSGFAVLHEFAGAPNDGRYPYGSLALDGSRLYGMTYQDGVNGAGVIFAINADGTGYELLHEFGGPPDDGGYPQNSFLLDGATLYGMTTYSGAADQGTIFKINTDGSGYELLHNFAGGEDDGRNPSSDVILLGSTLYGFTLEGGADNNGVIFSFELPTDITTTPTIPTLGEWGVIILVALLALAALVVMNRKTLQPDRTV